MARRATGRMGLIWIIFIAGVLACAALLASVASSGPPRRGPLLTAGTNFRLSSTVSNLTPDVSSSLVSRRPIPITGGSLSPPRQARW
jgi:hypothetical protein